MRLLHQSINQKWTYPALFSYNLSIVLHKFIEIIWKFVYRIILIASWFNLFFKLKLFGDTSKEFIKNIPSWKYLLEIINMILILALMLYQIYPSYQQMYKKHTNWCPCEVFVVAVENNVEAYWSRVCTQRYN